MRAQTSTACVAIASGCAGTGRGTAEEWLSRTWDLALTTSDLAVKCNVMHQPRTSLMAAAVKLASSSVSDSVMIRGGPSSTMSPSRPPAHPVEE